MLTLFSIALAPLLSVVYPYLLFSSLLVHFVNPVEAIPKKLAPRQDATNLPPCQQMFNPDDPSYSNTIFFTAKLAYDCLTSAPFNSSVAFDFLDYYNTTMQFQTTLDTLKNPPPSYQQPPFDIPAALTDIKQRIQAGEFQNEYEFEVAVLEVVYATHDAHINLNTGILSAFTFGSPLRIVSASTDGIELPRIYIADDLLEAIDQEVDWEPSAVVSINGNDTIEFLTQFAAINSRGYVEPMGDWNELMSSPAGDVQGIYSAFEGNTPFYPGENITFNFENGSSTGSLPWLAILSDSIIDDPPLLNTGQELYDYFVLQIVPSISGTSALSTTSLAAASTASPLAAATTPSAAASSTTPDYTVTPSSWDLLYPSPTLPPFPTNPVIAQPDLGDPNGGYVTGYFLNDAITAVLSIPSFGSTLGSVQTFSSTVGQFLNQSKAAGKTRFILDLQRNAGGSDLLATDAFRQFFPSIDPFSGSRLRAQPLADALGNTFTTFFTSQPIDDPDEYDELIADAWVSTVYLNAATGTNFTSWPEFFGPHPYNGDNFTTVQRNNLSSIIFDENATGDVDTDGIVIYGFGNRSATSPQPYLPEQIVILTDASCSSACGTFVELMHQQAGVRTVVAGGRPELGPMQTVGGSRGAEAYDAIALDEDIEFAESVNESLVRLLPDRSAGNYVNYASFNLKDSVRQGETVPLQFLYEPATCRIFYTTRTVYNYLNLWNYVVEAIWQNPSLCIAGTANGTTNYNATGPAVNDKATLAVPDSNIPSLILSGLQSGPQPGTEDATNQKSKRDSPPPPSPLPPSSTTPSLELQHIDDDGVINGDHCDACTRQGHTCTAVPTCHLGKLSHSASKVCVRTCTKHTNHGYPCGKKHFCYFPEGRAHGICLADKIAKALSHCKHETTSTSKAHHTKAVDGGKLHLAYAKPAP